MAKINFDNLIKVIGSLISVTSTTVVSEEIDLDLPRGFIAKIRKIMSTDGILIATDTDNNLFEVQSALLRDPDDASNVMPDLDNSNDVLYADVSDWLVLQSAAGHGAYHSQKSSLTFTELEDLITARNIRHNAQAGASTATIQSAFVNYYTLEKINDGDILNLLDIL